MVTPSTGRIVKGMPRYEYERRRWHTQTIDKKQASVEKIQTWSKSQSPLRRYFIDLRKRALKNGKEFTLTLDDIVVPKICPILGIKINPPGTDIARSGNNFSTDRIDNTKGYTKDNVQFISRRANTMKNNASPEELLKFADWVYRTYGS